MNIGAYWRFSEHSWSKGSYRWKTESVHTLEISLDTALKSFFSRLPLTPERLNICRRARPSFARIVPAASCSAEAWDASCPPSGAFRARRVSPYMFIGNPADSTEFDAGDMKQAEVAQFSG